MARFSLFIATPAYGGNLCEPYVQSLLGLRLARLISANSRGTARSA
ncbi:hypothetical protein [Bosea caraganae]|nr:hypothetical protein [Bosea caraganae]